MMISLVSESLASMGCVSNDDDQDQLLTLQQWDIILLDMIIMRTDFECYTNVLHRVNTRCRVKSI